MVTSESTGAHLNEERSVRILPLYTSALGEAILPGDDILAVQSRSDFCEMLARHQEGGGKLEFDAIAAALAVFAPTRVSTTTHPSWKEREAKEWEQIGRPKIMAAMVEFFLHGGLQRRLEQQHKLVEALQAAGLQFGDTAQLVDRIEHAGDWRKTFVDLAVMGRPLGIRFSAEVLDNAAASSALHAAGFTREQQHAIWANSRLPSISTTIKA